MIQSGVLRIFRMAVRGVCSLSALPVCFVSLLVRPVLSALSALSVLSCSVRSSIRPFVHSFGCSVSCSSVLSARPSACFVSPSLRSFVSVRSVRFACLLRPSICPSRSGAAEFYSADFAQCFVFSSQDVFSHPISDTLLKSRRGELGISDNNSYLWMQKMSFAHKNTTGYNEKS